MFKKNKEYIIVYTIDVLKEELNNYLYDITVIESDINIGKHTITILIKNIESNHFLQATVLFEEHIILSKNKFSIKIIVNTKMGMIRFEPVD